MNDGKGRARHARSRLPLNSEIPIDKCESKHEVGIAELVAEGANLRLTMILICRSGGIVHHNVGCSSWGDCWLEREAVLREPSCPVLDQVVQKEDEVTL